MKQLVICIIFAVGIIPLNISAGEKYLLRDGYGRDFWLQKETDCLVNPEGETWRLFLRKKEGSRNMGSPCYIGFDETKENVNISVSGVNLWFAVVNESSGADEQ